MDSLQRLYMLTAENLRRAREQKGKKKEEDTVKKDIKFKVGDLVLVKDVTSKVFEPRYMPNYRIVAIYGHNHIGVKDEAGKVTVRKSAHVKPVQLCDKMADQLPDVKVFNDFGRATKMLIHPKDVPTFDVPQDPERCETSHHSYKKDVSLASTDVDINELCCVTEQRECTETSVHSEQSTCEQDEQTTTEEDTNSTDTKMGSILKPLASLWSFVKTLNITPTDINTMDMGDLNSFLPTL